MKIYKTDTDNIIFTGDIHGNFGIIYDTIKSNNLSDCCIIFCGDIGLGFDNAKAYKETFKWLTKTLRKRNIHLYFFRGNHDSKEFFDGKMFSQFKYVHVMPDYSVIQTPSRSILCVGGAISIDRMVRIRKMDAAAKLYAEYFSYPTEAAYEHTRKTYWTDEINVYDENELDKLDSNYLKINTVCTHTCPSFCSPTTKDGVKYWMEIDSELSKDLDYERNVCDKLLDYLRSHGHPIQNWYYGHYHAHNVEIIDGIKYTMLDMSRKKMDLVH